MSSNQLFDAITASITHSLNPETKSVASYLTQLTEEKRQDVIDRKAQTIENLEKKIAKLSDQDNPNEDVLNAYVGLLRQAQSA